MDGHHASLIPPNVTVQNLIAAFEDAHWDVRSFRYVIRHFAERQVATLTHSKATTDAANSGRSNTEQEFWSQYTDYYDYDV